MVNICKKILLLYFVSFAGLVFSAGYLQAAPNKLTILTSVPPHAFVVELLVGDEVKVISLIDQGSDPHTYEPTPKQMLSISQASIFFTGGLEFERSLLGKISSVNRGLSIVNLDTLEEPSHNHEHKDQHSWLSPSLFSHQVDTIYSTLLKHLPAQKEIITIRYNHFRSEISKTEKQIRTLLKPHTGRAFYVFHPAFGHFGEAYGLRQEAVEVGRKRPTARQLQAIIKQAGADKVKVIFSQPQFDQRSAAVVASAIGAKITVLDPLAKDILANYLSIAKSFVASFQ